MVRFVFSILFWVGCVLAIGACFLIYKNLDVDLSEIEIAQLMLVTAAAFGALASAYNNGSA